MKLRLLVVLAALGWVGCGDGDEIRTQCLATCNSSVTFALETPLSWRELAISIGLPDGSIEHLDCQLGDTSAGCVPVRARIEPSFDASGALQSLRIGHPDTGTYAVQITADGAPAAAGSFSYQTPSDAPYTGPCPGIRCSGAQTFTLGD